MCKRKCFYSLGAVPYDARALSSKLRLVGSNGLAILVVGSNVNATFFRNGANRIISFGCGGSKLARVFYSYVGPGFYGRFTTVYVFLGSLSGRGVVGPNSSFFTMDKG